MKLKDITEKIFNDYTVRMIDCLGEFLSRVLGEVNFRKVHSFKFIENSSKKCNCRDYYHRGIYIFDEKCTSKADLSITYLTTGNGFNNGKFFTLYYCQNCFYNLLIIPLENLIKKLKKELL